MAQIELKQPQIVEAKNMVGVLVREQNGVDDAHPLAQQLLPQIRRRIDEQVAFWQAKERGTSRPFIARIGAGTNFAGTADRRHADARSRSEQNELPADVGGQDVAWHAAKFS